jgi:hypothetical protein
MSWEYDSGGKHQDHGKYAESFKRIFKDEWPCSECENSRAQGHKMSCSKHWRNKDEQSGS